MIVGVSPGIYFPTREIKVIPLALLISDPRVNSMGTYFEN